MPLNALIYFIKAPIKGKVKTRLAKSIGENKALDFYLHCVHKLLSLKVPQETDVFIAYDDLEEKDIPSFLKDKNIFLQSKGDLGQRMSDAFKHVFQLGYQSAILFGSDIPKVDASILEEAFALLSTSDVLVSPTIDGGYYAIGFHAKSFTSKAFENIIYSQNDVFSNTLKQLEPLHVSHGKMLQDIDNIEDLKAYDKTFFLLPHISVIIPVYYEDETLQKSIKHLVQHAKSSDFEVIVIDTYERTTVDKLPLKGVRIGYAPKGRANQMNEGALMARGDKLLFLHADTLLPKHWDTLIKDRVGAFSLGIATQNPLLKMIEKMANWRTSFTHIPYGDQALFFEASLFREFGGYASIPLMEDIEIMKRIKTKGIKIALLKEKVLTSPRRWKKEGIFYTTLRNRVLSLLYFLGVSPTLLKKYYP